MTYAPKTVRIALADLVARDGLSATSRRLNISIRILRQTLKGGLQHPTSIEALERRLFAAEQRA